MTRHEMYEYSVAAGAWLHILIYFCFDGDIKACEQLEVSSSTLRPQRLPLFLPTTLVLCYGNQHYCSVHTPNRLIS